MNCCVYLKAILEFRGDTRPISFQVIHYNLYSYGGMKFLLISSAIFLTVRPFNCQIKY